MKCEGQEGNKGKERSRRKERNVCRKVVLSVERTGGDAEMLTHSRIANEIKFFPGGLARESMDHNVPRRAV